MALLAVDWEWDPYLWNDGDFLPEIVQSDVSGADAIDLYHALRLHQPEESRQQRGLPCSRTPNHTHLRGGGGEYICLDEPTSFVQQKAVRKTSLLSSKLARNANANQYLKGEELAL